MAGPGYCSLLLFVSTCFTTIFALKYESSYTNWNLNQNETATDPLDYWGEWENHTFHPSPDNWRVPFYTLSLDRYANGDPTNDEANGTRFEHDWMSNQFRFGGDAQGLIDDLDYIQGMGIKVIYLIGSPFINAPWQGDGYSPLDLTLLDGHHGHIEDWRNLITAIHDRGMYCVLENTMATLGDLIGFVGHANDTAPFAWGEYNHFWKSDRRYLDFQPGNDTNTTCKYPRYWDNNGHYLANISSMETECKDSEFSLYGDLLGTAATGSVPVWQNQLSKFSGVQDRLREWQPTVLDKIKHFSCMQIASLDFDGFRMDKALQTNSDALGEFSQYQRECAKRYGKENFLIIGEVVGTNAMSSIYFGRGMQAGSYFTNFTEAAMATNTTNITEYTRDFGQSALDGTAFHYSIYGALTRFLGLDGPIGLYGVDFVSFWQSMMLEDDFVNANTGLLDPRHLFGSTSQDVLRWPALKQGIDRQLLAQFITFLMMPGAPQLYWGEEQQFELMDSTSPDYLYGRQPMSSNRGWSIHGCYNAGYETYVDLPLGPALLGCHDEVNGLDRRNPSNPVRNIVKRMFELRRHYPTLNDGFYLETLSNHTHDTYLPGSGGTPSPFGIWSIYRTALDGVQDLQGSGQGNQGVWLVYGNEPETKNYTFDCETAFTSLLAPFEADVTVKNLFYPYEEYTLSNSTTSAGCLSGLSLPPYGFKAFVPMASFVEPGPTITGVVPSHDSRLLADVELGQQQVVPIELHFSTSMKCDSVTNSLVINSTTQDGITAQLATDTISCTSVEQSTITTLVGEPATVFKWSADLENVSHGIHTITVNNASTANGSFTDSNDRFIFRIGEISNPVVFPTANYSSTLLHRDETGNLFITPAAPGADQLRYSTTWGSSWSSWVSYTGDNLTLEDQAWSGASAQKWAGQHVEVQFWSRAAGSAEHFQHGDLDASITRRWPHAFVLGSWNQWGYDNGLKSEMDLSSNGTWELNLAVEWPTNTTVNVWGMNPDGFPDKTMQYGDVDRDGILDWLSPVTLQTNNIRVADGPGWPYAAWKIKVNDGTYAYSFERSGSARHHAVVAALLFALPLITAFLSVWAFKMSFYDVKVNLVGLAVATGFPSVAFLAGLFKRKEVETEALESRTVLIATMEYEIEDWAIKIKIGGLGVMASLMGKALGHQKLIWVVPCVGGVDYPVDTPAEPMRISVNGSQYLIQVQYHCFRNITFVLLDAPVFRLQSKAVPYPARMDDLESAIYYSAWNACIAEAIKRFNPDLYHINDYHGTLAPLYLLPQTIPVSLSLHNSEFQGLWSLRSAKEMQEISSVFNLPKDVIKRYVQFGEVFNLLHAGASLLRIHQKGFGAVGVSKKYGIRALKRYPIFWGISNIGSLPNPDPADMGEWDGKLPDPKSIELDKEAEAGRGALRIQAQEWAGLEQNPNAELFVFVGRWSEQKGVDLIADVFPALLDKNPDVQLICVGPLIDLYGKFAALKLAKMMERYPGRVYSKPEFVALPPFLFSGAEFALIPSRDEPFGLVAVEFGRKGALGVGSRVGGLGQMPGWWYPIESMAPKHLVRQFKSAIQSALASSHDTRALMRARSSVQRFPVAQWIKDLDTLQSTSIKIHRKIASKPKMSLSIPGTGVSTPTMFPSTPGGLSTAASSRAPSLFRMTRHGDTEPQTPGGRSSIPSMPVTAMSTAVPTRAPSPERTRPLTSGTASGSATPVMPRVSSKHNLSNLLGSRLKALAEVEKQNRNAGELANQRSHGSEESERAGRPSGFNRSSNGSTEVPLPHELQALADNNMSTLTIDTVAAGRKDFKLQNVDPFFNDPNGRYYDSFEKDLDEHIEDLSADKLCVEDYLKKSEKDWFGRFYDVKLGKPPAKVAADTTVDEFQLNHDHVAPTLLKNWLQRKVGDWPVYTFLLAFGQIIAANSYQITLLTGTNGQTAERLYTISSIFLGATIVWWILSRHIKSYVLLSVPFLFYGAAFFLLGMTPYASSSAATTWMQNVASGLYAFASASGFLFFTLNFGTEGGTAVRAWVFRACIIQGIQGIYIAALWYWGDYISSLSNSGGTITVLTTSSPVVSAVTIPIAGLIWIVGLVLFIGLPDAYRSKPGNVPAFYSSLLRRKVIVWFLVVVAIQNFWLSGPYGRNWSYLWSSTHAPAWSVAILVIVFFVGVWILMLWGLAKLSSEHSWALPLFAIGLGAPRWAQELWGTSGIGLYLPWVLSGANDPTARLVGALVGRGLWLWLGVLDTLQGVGFGMILMQTLTRVHMAGAIACAQVVGSAFTILARAEAPNATGPGTVFPNLAIDFWDGISDVYFWVALVMQLVAAAGFFVFFRKEQLFKP
ncbi:unnamed protein product [Discula destructiva]